MDKVLQEAKTILKNSSEKQKNEHLKIIIKAIKGDELTLNDKIEEIAKDILFASENFTFKEKLLTILDILKFELNLICQNEVTKKNILMGLNAISDPATKEFSRLNIFLKVKLSKDKNIENYKYVFTMFKELHELYYSQQISKQELQLISDHIDKSNHFNIKHLIDRSYLTKQI